jgi:oligoribonuclease (3'-5' exoribonuclease)
VLDRAYDFAYRNLDVLALEELQAAYSRHVLARPKTRELELELATLDGAKRRQLAREIIKDVALAKAAGIPQIQHLAMVRLK